MGEFWTEIEVAKITRLSRSKLRQDRVRVIGLPFAKVGGRVFYREADVIAFVDRHTFRSTAEASRREMIAA